MTVVRCTAKLLKRLKQPAKPPEPEPQFNPPGEWYADIDIWRRQPFAAMLNATTGALLVLLGNAEGLRRLQERALLQFAMLCEHFGISGAGVDAELHGFDAGFAYAATRDRNLLSTMNQRQFGVWLRFEHGDLPLADAAAQEWASLFQHKSLGRIVRATWNTTDHSIWFRSG